MRLQRGDFINRFPFFRGFGESFGERGAVGHANEFRVALGGMAESGGGAVECVVWCADGTASVEDWGVGGDGAGVLVGLDGFGEGRRGVGAGAG